MSALAEAMVEKTTEAADKAADVAASEEGGEFDDAAGSIADQLGVDKDTFAADLKRAIMACLPSEY
jgi:hypothetical protein